HAKPLPFRAEAKVGEEPRLVLVEMQPGLALAIENAAAGFLQPARPDSRNQVGQRIEGFWTGVLHDVSRIRRLRRCTHARLIDEALGRRIDRAPGAPARRMDIKGAPTDRHLRTIARWGRGRQRDLILDRLHMVGEQHFRAVDTVELEQAFDKIGLTAPCTPSERANSKASKLRPSGMRLRYFLSPSSSIASRPRNMYATPSCFQKRNASLLRSNTSPRVSR